MTCKIVGATLLILVIILFMVGLSTSFSFYNDDSKKEQQDKTYYFKTSAHNIHLADNNGHTPLHTAVLTQDLEIVKTIMNFGPDIEAYNKLGETALHIAVKLQAKNIAFFLLDSGANPIAVDYNYSTPLHNLLKSTSHSTSLDLWSKTNNCTKFIDMVKEMLRKGSLTNLQDNEGVTPLHLAIHMKQHELIEVFLKYAEMRDLIRNDTMFDMFYLVV